MNKFISIIKISRPTNVLITIGVVVVAILISQNQEIKSEIYFLASLAAALTTAAGNIINDIFDIETDKISHPNRVLVTGALTQNEAWYVYLFFNLCAMLTAAILPSQVLLIVIISLLLLYTYSAYLKKIVLIGNITVAGLTGLAFIYGGIVANNLKASIIPAVFAFLINLIREIIKDMEDIEGDYKQQIITFPIRFGISKTKYLASGLMILLMVFTFYPFILSIYKIEYFLVIMLVVNPILVLIIKLLFKKSDNNYNLISRLLKINMVIGLIAILAGN